MSDGKFAMATCAGKQVFTASQAMKVRDRQARQRKNGKMFRADAYRCKFCGKWHVGSEMKT